MSRHHVGLSSRRWGRVRREVLDRDGWRCQSCGRAGRLEADHIEALEVGGDPWALTNLQALCKACHKAKTRTEHGDTRSEVEAWRAVIDRLSTGRG